MSTTHSAIIIINSDICNFAKLAMVLQVQPKLSKHPKVWYKPRKQRHRNSCGGNATIFLPPKVCTWYDPWNTIHPYPSGTTVYVSTAQAPLTSIRGKLCARRCQGKQ